MSTAPRASVSYAFKQGGNVANMNAAWLEREERAQALWAAFLAIPQARDERRRPVGVWCRSSAEPHDSGWSVWTVAGDEPLIEYIEPGRDAASLELWAMSAPLAWVCGGCGTKKSLHGTDLLALALTAYAKDSRSGRYYRVFL